MTALTHLVVGLRTATPVAVTVSAARAPRAPRRLLVVARDGGRRLVAHEGEAWRVALAPGEYCLRLSAASGECLGSIRVVAEPAVTFVRRAGTRLVAWTAAAAATLTRAVEDPKDPWPPPGRPRSSLGDSAWFDVTLAGLVRTGALGKGL